MSTQPSSAQLTIVLGMAAILVLAGCSGYEPRSAGQSRDATPRSTEQLPPASRGRSAGEQAAVVAVRQVGMPYRYGGNNVGGFDCSGLVQFAYAATGKLLPRTTADLWQQMPPVLDRNLEVGDVLFFNIEGKVAHVGLYLGNRRFVHAPATGREVSIADLDSDFYRSAFIRGGRPR
jgi:cell wall-associated NlpC family hydrolase